MNEIKIAEWVVVNSPGGRYLGKVSPVHVLDPDDFLMIKKEVLDHIHAGHYLELSQAFDFMAPLRPVQQGPGGAVQFTRDTIVIPPDFTLHPLPIYVKVSSIYFCGDMKESDQRTYKGFVQRALDMMIQTKAAELGIQLASSLPPQKGI